MKPKVLSLTLTALFAVITVLCSMISVPAAIPFTLQTFGIFLSLFVLGGKYGTLSITVYILLGAVGLPVFHGFTGGVGTLASSTGGYIIGFILSDLVYMLITKLAGESSKAKLISAFIGLILCYIAGTLWFTVTSSQGNGFSSALLTCVVPFIIPDTIKILLAFFISQRLKKINRLNAV